MAATAAMEGARTRVFFLGASAVSAEAADFATQLGFEVIVADDVQEKLDAPAFSDCECIQVDFDDMPDLGIEEDDMVCVITRGHVHDPQAFLYALGTPAFYVGMMGSAKKNAKVFAYCREHGCDELRLEAAYAPIGENIGAVDAKEIGLSIAAQLVRVRNAYNPREKDKESLHRD